MRGNAVVMTTERLIRLVGNSSTENNDGSGHRSPLTETHRHTVTAYELRQPERQPSKGGDVHILSQSLIVSLRLFSLLGQQLV